MSDKYNPSSAAVLRSHGGASGLDFNLENGFLLRKKKCQVVNEALKIEFQKFPANTKQGLTHILSALKCCLSSSHLKRVVLIR